MNEFWVSLRRAAVATLSRGFALAVSVAGEAATGHLQQHGRSLRVRATHRF